jgi:uncharacterized protein (UPF0335 family)
MGKKAKEHRKKVAKRNERVKLEEKQINNLQRKIFEEAKQRYYDNLSAKTENTLQIKLND